MNTTLHSRALETIFFNQQKISEINALAKEIDPRLFIFAPFKPTLLPKGACAHSCFYFSVINGYGLIWDCGRIFWEICRKPQRIEKRPKELLDILGLSVASETETTRLLLSIHSIRTDVCHTSGYSLIDNSKFHEDYIKKFTNNKSAENAEDDWERLCIALYDQHDKMINMIQNLLNAINNSSEHKEIIADYLLNTLCAVWNNKEEPLLMALGHLYRLSNACRGRQANHKLTWHKLKEWVENGRCQQKVPNNQLRDFAAFLSEVSRKFKNIVLDKDVCPITTDPMEIFIAVIKSNYAWQDSSFHVLDA